MKYLFAFFISFNCFADEWRTEDTQREAVYMALHAIDWAQTLQIRHHETVQEGGVIASLIIGRNPTNAQVNRYMAGSTVLQYLIADNLSHEYRSIFQYLTIADSGLSVVVNFRIGLNF